MKYFSEIVKNPRDGTTFSCPDLSNPADYFMSMMSIESIDKKDFNEDEDEKISQSQLFIETTYKDRIEIFKNAYKNSDLMRDPYKLIENYSPVSQDSADIKQISWFYEWKLLAYRNL